MSANKINVAVAGATGYVGLDLVKILSGHPRVQISYLCAQKKIGKKIQFFDKRIKKKLPKISKLKSVDWNKVDVLFTSLPTGESQIIVKELLNYENLKIIDLGADFRLKSALSCLFEDGDKEALRLLRRIDLLISTSKEKLKLLSTALRKKITVFENVDLDNHSDCIFY